MEGVGEKMQEISYAGTLVFSFLSNENRITDCCCTPAPARFGLYFQEYNTKEGRTGGLRTSNLISWLCQTCWGYICSKCLAQDWAQSMFMHCLSGRLKSLAGLQHPHGQVQGPPWLEQWGKAHQTGDGAGGPCRDRMPGVGLLLLPLWCQPVRTFSACLWCEVKMKPFQWRYSQPWHHLSPWLQVRCAQVLTWWDLVGWSVAGWDAPGDRLSSQLGHGTGCTSTALLCSAFSVSDVMV